MEPWLIFQRGLHREQISAEGLRSGHVSDEVPQRAMWQHWLKLMQSKR